MTHGHYPWLSMDSDVRIILGLWTSQQLDSCNRWDLWDVNSRGTRGPLTHSSMAMASTNGNLWDDQKLTSRKLSGLKQMDGQPKSAQASRKKINYISFLWLFAKPRTRICKHHQSTNILWHFDIGSSRLLWTLEYQSHISRLRAIWTWHKFINLVYISHKYLIDC